MEQKQRPIILEIEETKIELIQCVNSIMQKHKVPFYFLEPIFNDIYTQVKVSAQNEIEMAKAQLEKENSIGKGAE